MIRPLTALLFTTLLLSCHNGEKSTSTTTSPKLPPAPKPVVRTAPKVVGNPFRGDLNLLYACMLENAYKYMFMEREKGKELWGDKKAGADTGVAKLDDVGIFAAGTRGFYFYANLNTCLAKSMGVSKKGNSKTPFIEKVSGLTIIRGMLFRNMRRINPEMVTWCAANLIPKPEASFMGTTYGRVYHAVLFRAARLFLHAYLYIKPNIGTAAEAYRIHASKPSADISVHLKTTYHGKLKKWYHLDQNGTYLTGFQAIGFWIRRHLDGSADAFYKALIKLMSSYDKAYLTRLGIHTTP